MSPQYGELRLTSAWDRMTSLGYPCKFQLVSRLGSITAWHLVVGVSQTLRCWTEGATYIWQSNHHVGHWPTFLVFTFLVCRPSFVGRHKCTVTELQRCAVLFTQISTDWLIDWLIDWKFTAVKMEIVLVVVEANMSCTVHVMAEWWDAWYSKVKTVCCWFRRCSCSHQCRTWLK